MIKPALLIVDDDAEVLRAVGRDVRREFGESYRIVQAGSGQSALDALKQLNLRGEPLALLLVDQRMPGMSGTELLERAMPIYPAAKRALLTAYADTQAAIDAINKARVDHYLQKPWEPPEERLYPILRELLDDWEAGFHPPFEGLRLIGHRWSPQAHRLKEFLARNNVPYQWLDLESNAEAAELLTQTGLAQPGLPLALFADGSVLERAEVGAVAERVGLATRSEHDFYQFVIVGAGPSGLAAAVYAASEGLSTLLIEEVAPGGQAGQSSRIENYLGFPGGIGGGELARRAAQQARKFGAQFISQRASGVRVDGQFRHVLLADGREVACHALLIASGVSYRRLDKPGVNELVGAGVYYGAANTEARDCQGEEVYVLGGANSAGQAAIHLAQFAKRVGLLVRGPSLDAMSQYLIEQVNATPNIEVRLSTEVEAARGEGHLQELVLRPVKGGEGEVVPASRLFIFIGAEPHTQWLGEVVARDANGFVKTGAGLAGVGSVGAGLAGAGSAGGGPAGVGSAGTGSAVSLRKASGWPLERDPFLLETNVPGIFAAGDVRAGSVKRVASGVGEGAMVVSFVHQHLAKL